MSGSADHLEQVVRATFQLLHGNEDPEDPVQWLAGRLLHNPDVIPPHDLGKEEFRAAESRAVVARHAAMSLVDGSLPFGPFIEQVDGAAPRNRRVVKQLRKALQRLKPELKLAQLPPLPDSPEACVPTRFVKIPMTLVLRMSPARLPDIDRVYTEVVHELEGVAGAALERAVRENDYLGPMLAPVDDPVEMHMARPDGDLVEEAQKRRSPTRTAARRAIRRHLNKSTTGRDYDLEWVEPNSHAGGYWVARVPDIRNPEREDRYRVYTVEGPGGREAVTVERLL